MNKLWNFLFQAVSHGWFQSFKAYHQELCRNYWKLIVDAKRYLYKIKKCHLKVKSVSWIEQYMKKLCFKNVLLTLLLHKRLENKKCLTAMQNFLQYHNNNFVEVSQGSKNQLNSKDWDHRPTSWQTIWDCNTLLSLDCSNINLLLASFLFLIRVSNVIDFRHPMWKQNT